MVFVVRVKDDVVVGGEARRDSLPPSLEAGGVGYHIAIIST